MVKAIVGANWGDEGKGKITDMLAADSDIVIRFQGRCKRRSHYYKRIRKICIASSSVRFIQSECNKYDRKRCCT